MKSQTASGGGVALTAGGAPGPKKEKIAPQATAEQLRIAEITNVGNEQDSAELHKNIKNIVEFTGKSQDEAAMALHDCHGNVEEAITLLLDDSSVSWETSGKKKKDKQLPEPIPTAGRRGGHGDSGGRGRGRAPVRQQGGPPGPTGGRGRARTERGARSGLPARGDGSRGGAGRLPDGSQPPASGHNKGNANNKRDHTAGDENSPIANWKTNGNNNNNNGGEYIEGSQPLKQSTNKQLANQATDTIGNMGNWDDFKNEQKNEWASGKKDRPTEWVDVAAGGERNNREWKTRQRQGGPVSGQQTQQTKVPGQVIQNPNGGAKQEAVTKSQIQGGHHQDHQNKPMQTAQRNSNIVSRGAPMGVQSRTRVRLPPTSKIPQTPVEMPPDHHLHELHGNSSLDVSFGVLSFGTNSFESISNLSPNKMDHNGMVPSSQGIPSANSSHSLVSSQVVSSHQNQPSVGVSNLQQLKPQVGQSVVDVKSTSGGLSASQQVERQMSGHLGPSGMGSGAVPPGLDKASVTSSSSVATSSIVGSSQSQTHNKSLASSVSQGAQQQVNNSSSVVNSSSSVYHSSGSYQPYQSSTASSNSQAGYKQQNPNMAYLHNLTGMYSTGGHNSTGYSQQTTAYGNPASYGSSFGASSVSSGGYKSKNESTVGSSSTGAGNSTGVSDTVSSSVSSQYDVSGQKSSQQQLQQQQAMQQQAGGMVLQPSQMHGPPHMHAAAPFAHMTGHPAPMQTLYSYYQHVPGHVPPPTGSGHLTAATDYQQQQRESSSSSGAGGGSAAANLSAAANSLMQQQQQQQQQQQHSYDKFVRSQDDGSSQSGGSASQQQSGGGSSSTVVGSQSSMATTAAYPPHIPYHIYYGGHTVQSAYPPMPYALSAQVTGYGPTTSAGSSNSQANSQVSKSTNSYGNAKSAFDYQLPGHLSSPGAEYNKYQTNKMMSNANKYLSTATAPDRR